MKMKLSRHGLLGSIWFVMVLIMNTTKLCLSNTTVGTTQTTASTTSELDNNPTERPSPTTERRVTILKVTASINNTTQRPSPTIKGTSINNTTQRPTSTAGPSTDNSTHQTTATTVTPPVNITINNIYTVGNRYEGSAHTIICIVDFTGTANFSSVWKRNGSVINPLPISPSRWVISTSKEPQYRERWNFNLTVVRLLPGDNGFYSLTVMNDFMTKEETVFLNVIGKPVVSVPRRLTVVDLGEPVNLECNVIQSYSTNTSIVVYENGQLFQFWPGPVTSIWYKFYPNQTATYDCAGGNVAGEGKRVSVRVVVLKPEVVYKYCPLDVDSFNTTWNSTVDDSVVVLQCTERYTGVVSRVCNRYGIWEEPDYSRCIRKNIQDLFEQSESLKDGVLVVEPDTILNSLKEQTSSENDDLRSGDLELSSSTLDNVANFLSDREDSISIDQLEIFVNACNSLLEDKHGRHWIQLRNLNLNGVTKVAKAVTTYIKAFTSVNSSMFNMIVHRDNLVVQVGKTLSKNLTFPDRSEQLPPWIKESKTEINLRNAFLNDSQPLTYSSAYYRNISHLFHPFLESNGEIRPIDNDYTVNSVIVDFSVDPSPEILGTPIIAEFQHLDLALSRPACVFWNFSLLNTTNGAWSADGSRLISATDVSTICEYNHTTNFAILMSPGKTSVDHSRALSVISAVGCSISILFLVVTVILYVLFWRFVKGDRAIILVNLCIALILSYTLFLSGVERTENKDTCKAVAVLLHYLFLADFSLMLAEGVEIALSVIYVFSTKSKAVWLVPVSWAIPAVIVAISAGVTQLDGYGNISSCWLSIESGLLWAFVGPALLVIVMNTVILIVVLRKMFSTRAMMTKTTREKSKTAIRSLFVILPLFGITWVFGVFSVNEDLVIFQYFFAISNSIQGVLIFVFHCFLNKRIREGFQLMLRKRRSSKYTDSKSTSRRESKVVCNTITDDYTDYSNGETNSDIRHSFQEKTDAERNWHKAKIVTKAAGYCVKIKDVHTQNPITLNTLHKLQ